MTVDRHPIERIIGVVVLFAGFSDRLRKARVLRALMAVHEDSHVPGVLLAQGAALSQGHVGLDETCRIGQLVHAGAPVKRLRSPQRREHLFVAGALAQAVRAVAQSTVLRVNLLGPRVIGGLRWFLELGIAAARQRRSDRRAFGKPEGIGLQRREISSSAGGALPFMLYRKQPWMREASVSTWPVTGSMAARAPVAQWMRKGPSFSRMTRSSSST